MQTLTLGTGLGTGFGKPVFPRDNQEFKKRSQPHFRSPDLNRFHYLAERSHRPQSYTIRGNFLHMSLENCGRADLQE